MTPRRQYDIYVCLKEVGRGQSPGGRREIERIGYGARENIRCKESKEKGKGRCLEISKRIKLIFEY